MSFVPIDELKDRGGLTLAPMIDFLFLMLAVFASLAVTRVAMSDTEINLVKAKTESLGVTKQINLASSQFKVINLSISDEGQYKWITEIRDHEMASCGEIAEELLRQYHRGLLPEDKSKTQIFLKIDKKAQWEPILKLILSIQEIGFDIHPVYEPTLDSD
ncbi:MAG: hypothetical protein KDK55_05435 [Chlamydiia bacterium]|nr:hypothetical protein [Chlamydiia bacterium]